MSMTSAEIFELLDAPTTAPAWPKNGYGNAEKRHELELPKEKGETTGVEDEGPKREFHFALANGLPLQKNGY